ncbi:MAG: CHAP domain-containing protein [Nitrospirota bacterium]|nr:CHAP domain-containing protein [Nitrospirota bacterium]
MAMKREKAKMPAAIAAVAKGEIGVEEVNGTNCGPRVDEYKAATWLNPRRGWPWCAAFVCWVVREAATAAGVRFTSRFKRPRTAGAWDMENWSLAQDLSTWTKKPHRGDIQPGDIVVFRFSHIGFAISRPDRNGYVRTVEGNTDAAGRREGGGVYTKRRHVSKIRSRIRFRV